MLNVLIFLSDFWDFVTYAMILNEKEKKREDVGKNEMAILLMEFESEYRIKS